MSASAKEKIDLFKSYKDEYVAPRKPVIVTITPANYLTITGAGKPGGPEFEACIGALYGAAFTIKMTRKFGGKQDYAVGKLEGQWWADNEKDLSRVRPEQWQWKLMIRTPEFVKQEELARAVLVLLKRGKGEDVKRVKLETMEEGACVQMLHVGPYDKECETIAQMKAFAEKQHYVFHGSHHEIYLSDPRRVPPERLKTILRELVRKS
jgi:hypothetical protein